MLRAVLTMCGLVTSTIFMSMNAQAVTPDPPQADPSGINKVRFISFLVPPAPEGEAPETSLRVHLVSLHHVSPPYNTGPSIPFTLFEGQSVWVGPPSNFIESTSNGISFRAAWTQCTPHYQDWSVQGPATLQILHVTGAHIVPSSIYEVEQVPVACAGMEDSCGTVSTRLEIRTTRWADMASSFNPPSPLTQPDIADCSILIHKFRSSLGAPIKARAFQAANNPFGEISSATLTNDMGFSHIAAFVEGFRGWGYPYKMGKCAISLPPPSANACSTDAECGANGPCNLYCPG